MIEKLKYLESNVSDFAEASNFDFASLKLLPDELKKIYEYKIYLDND